MQVIICVFCEDQKCVSPVAPVHEPWDDHGLTGDTPTMAVESSFHQDPCHHSGIGHQPEKEKEKEMSMSALQLNEVS